MPTDTELVLSQLLDDSDLTTFDHNYLDKQVKDLRETGNREITAFCRRGEILTATKEAVGHGFFLKWTADCRERWLRTEGREGFMWSDASVENYMNLYALSAGETATIYHEYKRLGAGIMYKLARWVLDGKDPEALLDQLRRNKALTDGETDAIPASIPASRTNGNTPINTAAFIAYPALAQLVDNGKLHEREAVRIAEATEASNDNRVKNVIARFGARDADTVASLTSIARSMDKASAEGIVVEDDIFSQLNTTGYIHLATGDQVTLADATPRDVWGGYKTQRKEAGASKSADKIVFREETTQETVLWFLKEFKRPDLFPGVLGDGHEQVYQITVRRLVAE